ncbi:MAG: PQQ-binding-like beta-propeller repeat protein, partial [Clostridia bacterium]|nr:PQQ-binding-like beta-propeller repeat protein [Clostridia bacterium]
MKKRIFIIAALLLIACLVPPSALAQSGGWTSFRGSSDNNAALPSPISQGCDTFSLSWDYQLKERGDWRTKISDIVISDDILYIAVGDRLLAIGTDGEVVFEHTLAAEIDSTCRPVTAQGMIIIPLGGGAVEAIDLASRERVWLSEPVGEEHQSLTTLTVHEDRLFVGTVSLLSDGSCGAYRCIRLSDGEVLWQYDNEDGGYYWSGGVIAHGNIIVGGDDGVLTALSCDSGAASDTLDLAAPI